MRVGHTPSRELRILQVSTAEHAGGAERVAWNLFQAYRKQGYKSWLCVGKKDSADPEVLELEHREYRNKMSRFLLRFSDYAQVSQGRVRGMGKLCALIDAMARPGSWLSRQRGIEDYDFPASYSVLNLTRTKPSLLHCHNLHGGYFDLRALSWLSSQVPVVLTLHDAWLLSGHCAHSFDCDRWQWGCGNCPDLTVKPAIPRDATAYNWKRKRDIYANSNLAVCTPSSWLMNKVEQSMLGGREYRVIPNGVDLTVFRPGDKMAARASLGLPMEADIILLGRYRPKRDMWKDSTTMDETIRALTARKRGRMIVFVALGKERDVQQLSGAEIHWIPYQREETHMAHVYQAADLYVHAAKADTFPNSVIEALSCGVPVIATAIGGIPEQIENGVTGFLTRPSDPKPMVEAVEQLLDDLELRLRFAAQAVESARLRFGLERQVDEYLDWYEQLVEKFEISRSS